jgi:hypothetical protein
MKLYGAIDLHSTNSVTVLIDEHDNVVYRKRLPNDLRLIIEELAPYQSRMAGIVVESTYNWYWLVDGLRRLAQGSNHPEVHGVRFSVREGMSKCLVVICHFDTII